MRNTMLDIMSVKLDGTDTKRVYTLGSNSLSVGMFETDGGVFALFVDGDANLVSLNLESGVETKADEKVTSSALDVENASIVYTKDVVTEKENQGTETTADYNELYVLKAGQTAPSKIMTGQHADGQDVSYDFDVSIASAANGFVYFNISSDAHGRDGMYRISQSVTDKRLARRDAALQKRAFGSLGLSGRIRVLQQHEQIYSVCKRGAGGEKSLLHRNVAHVQVYRGRNAVF